MLQSEAQLRQTHPIQLPASRAKVKKIFLMANLAALFQLGFEKPIGSLRWQEIRRLQAESCR